MSMKIAQKLAIYFAALGLWLAHTSCTPTEVVPTDASLTLNLAHLVDNSPIIFDTQRYTNAVGNEYNIKEFKYYLSNVKLRNRATGAFYHVPDSYHLIAPDAQNHVVRLNLANIPAGQYNELEFAIGVDNAKNTSLDNVGDLDPSNNMAWDWNTGYKFLLLEGSYFPPSGAQRGLVYHIGSDANYRILRFPLAEGVQNAVSLAGGKTTRIDFDVEVSQIFKDPTDIDFAQHNVVMFEAISRNVADNYAKNMITLRTVVVE